MTTDERIASLEARIAQLEARMARQEDPYKNGYPSPGFIQNPPVPPFDFDKYRPYRWGPPGTVVVSGTAAHSEPK